jgi:hypothetical protein
VQIGQMKRKVNLIKLDGNHNADNPLRITGDPFDSTFQVDQEFGLYTEGTLTARAYFGKISRGTYQAYECQYPSGQKSVILQRTY